MLLSLQNAFRELLTSSYPDVFGGAAPPVEIEFPTYAWTFDASSADATAGEPAQDDARDLLVFDPADPEGPYTLSRPPYPGPKRVYLRTPVGDRVTLGPAEVAWHPVDSRVFTLHPRPSRALAGFDQVEVLYGVTAVFTKLKSMHRMPVSLSGPDNAAVERATVLAMGAFALNRGRVIANGAFADAEGDYQVAGEIKSLKLNQGSATGPGARTLSLDAEVELKVSRALAEDEGAPITHILSPGATAGARRIDVRMDVEA
jgi:hypothetical protein